MSTAEEKLKSLEDRIIGLESSVSTNKNESGEEALKAYQEHILGKLKLIREALVANADDGSSSVHFQAVKAERDQLATENKQLKVEIERLNYRVKHLIKALNEEESKNAGK